MSALLFSKNQWNNVKVVNNIRAKQIYGKQIKPPSQKLNLLKYSKKQWNNVKVANNIILLQVQFLTRWFYLLPTSLLYCYIVCHLHIIPLVFLNTSAGSICDIVVLFTSHRSALLLYCLPPSHYSIDFVKMYLQVQFLTWWFYLLPICLLCCYIVCHLHIIPLIFFKYFCRFNLWHSGFIYFP